MCFVHWDKIAQSGPCQNCFIHLKLQEAHNFKGTKSNMKIIQIILLSSSWAFTLASVPTALAVDSPPATYVRGTADDGAGKNFRTTGNVLKTNSQPPSLVGLADLHTSGSAQFTPSRLKQILKQINAQFHGPVTVFDLRQEEHIFLNGQPINVQPAYWDKISALHDAIVSDEESQVKKLAPGMKLTVFDKHALKSGSGQTTTNIIVSQVTAEREIVTADGANYVRITVKDGGLPTDEEMDRFILSVRQLSPDSWVHFHCQAGHGRTTRFLALYDMLRNARQVSLHDILVRQSLLVGEPDLLLSEKEDKGQESRTSYFQRFYDYARANPDGQPELWSQWLKKKKPQ